MFLIHFLCALTASGLRMEQPRLPRHVTAGKVCSLPCSLTHSTQGIATSPPPGLMTALSQNKLKAGSGMCTTACQNQGASLPDTDLPRAMDTWCFVFVFQKKRKNKPPKNETYKRGYGIFSQRSPSALSPNKRGDREGAGKGVSALREGKVLYEGFVGAGHCTGAT